MTKHHFRFLFLITICLLLFLLGSGGLFLRTQSILTKQLAHLNGQSLPTDGPTPSLTVQNTQATGWPFGSWRRLSGVSFRTYLNGTDIAGATPELLLGGNWLDWARTFTSQDGLPLHAPRSTIVRLVRHGEAITLRLDHLKLHVRKEDDIPHPAPQPSSTLPSKPNKIYWARFTFNTTEIASSRLPHSLILTHLAGTMRIAPRQHLPQTIEEQNRALLSASLTADQLIYPTALLHNLSIEQLHTSFALLPALTPLPQPHENTASSSSYNALIYPALRLRIHDLGATFRPLAESDEEDSPPPRLTMGGELTLPAFSGALTVSLTDWKTPLRTTLNSLWFRQITPQNMQSLLHELIVSPRMDTLSAHPLTITVPLEHGIPPGLSAEKINTLYHQFLQLAPAP